MIPEPNDRNGYHRHQTTGSPEGDTMTSVLEHFETRLHDDIFEPVAQLGDKVKAIFDEHAGEIASALDVADKVAHNPAALRVLDAVLNPVDAQFVVRMVDMLDQKAHDDENGAVGLDAEPDQPAA